MSASGQKRPFVPDPPNVRFAPIADKGIFWGKKAWRRNQSRTAAMKICFKVAALTAIVFISDNSFAAAQTTSEKRSVDFYNGFIGRWEGDFQPIPSQVFFPSPPNAPATNAENPPITQVAFSISASSMQVYIRPVGGVWREINPGSWRGTMGRTNAVIFSITSGTDSDGDGWVETWNFTITHKERDSLDVVMTRAVNNYNKPSDFLVQTDKGIASGRFFRIIYGEMTRPDTTGK
jgi:hypothetical protein